MRASSPCLKPGDSGPIFLLILEEFGPHIGMSYVRYLNNDLWELRTPFGGQSFRVFFFIDGNKLVAVHAIVKKSAKTPSRDLDTAIARMKEYKQRKDVAK